MKKKRKPTAAELRVLRLRKASRRIGYRDGYGKGYEHARKPLHARIAELEHEYHREINLLSSRQMSVEKHETLCRESRIAGYETGFLVGVEKTTAKLREFYETQRREYEAAGSPPETSSWEDVCASSLRGDS